MAGFGCTEGKKGGCLWTREPCHKNGLRRSNGVSPSANSFRAWPFANVPSHYMVN